MNNIKLLATVAVVASAFAASGAYAQEDTTKAYVSVHGGVLFSDSVDTTFVSGNNGSDIAATTKTDTGYRIGGALGYNLTSNIAIEGEVSYASANLSEVAIAAETATPVDGKSSTLSLMSNVIVGANMGAFRPYIGAGVGAVKVKIDVPAGEFGPDAAQDSQWEFGAQALAGVDYAVANNISLGARYRYQHVGATNMVDAAADAIALGSLSKHSIEAVLKFGF